MMVLLLLFTDIAIRFLIVRFIFGLLFGHVEPFTLDAIAGLAAAYAMASAQAASRVATRATLLALVKSIERYEVEQ